MDSMTPAGYRHRPMLRASVLIAVSVILGLPVGLAPGGAQPVKNTAMVVLLGDDAAMGPLPSEWREAFGKGLKDLGWVERRNLRLEHRSARTRELRPEIAAEVVKLS